MKHFYRLATINPLGWLVIGVAAAILVLVLGCNLAPRDPRPERTPIPSPSALCTTHGEGFPQCVQ